MKESILNFAKQFEYEPEIINADQLGKHSVFVIAGMGGSGLSGDIIKAVYPELNLIIRKDYGLPEGVPDDSLVIANSYSGNTEEIIDALNEAQGRGLETAVISTGGKLLDWAKDNQAPFIKLPETGIQPRMALGFNSKALVKIMGFDSAFADLTELSSILKPEEQESDGASLAQNLKGKIPIIYTSRSNWAVAYNWKIIFNETAKIPAFCNVFPELNHNEMTGFDVKESTRQLSDKFIFIMIKDEEDNPQVQKRFDILKNMYMNRGLSVIELSLNSEKRFEKIFSSIILASWTGYNLAQIYGVEAEKVPMVEEFKKMLE